MYVVNIYSVRTRIFHYRTNVTCTIIIESLWIYKYSNIFEAYIIPTNCLPSLYDIDWLSREQTPAFVKWTRRRGCCCCWEPSGRKWNDWSVDVGKQSASFPNFHHHFLIERESSKAEDKYLGQHTVVVCGDCSTPISPCSNHFLSGLCIFMGFHVLNKSTT